MAGVSTAVAAPATPPPVLDNKPAAGDAPADAKKDSRKPRRERLPLPDPLPTAPVKRYTEPSKADLQAALDVEEAKVQACFDRLNSTRAFYDARQKIRDEGKPVFEAARKQFVKLNDECRQLFEERKEITNKLKAIKEADFASRQAATGAGPDIVGAGKDGTEALRGIRTMEELEKKIKDYEFDLATNSLPIAEEKKVVAQISFLAHRGRSIIIKRDKSFKNEKAAKEIRVLSRQELEAARNRLDTQIDAAKAKVEEQKKAVDKIRAEQDAEIKKLQSTTADIDRDQEKKKIGEIKAIIRQLREEFQVELDKWYLNERIHYEQQKIAKKKKYEAVQAERDARRKAWEDEQAQYPEPDPYQEEKDMCSGLMVYMQTLLGETVEKPSVNLRPTDTDAVAPSLKSTSASREITAEGKTIGKSTNGKTDGFENLAFSDFVKKSGRSKGKKGRRAVATPGTETPVESADIVLKPHSIDYLAAFTALDIKPPNKISEVRDALEAVKSKKAYYDSAPKPSEEEKAQLAAKKSKKQVAASSEKSPKSNGVDLMNGDGGAAAFPTLSAENEAPGAASNQIRDISGPSFIAVVSGAASAPAPAPSTVAASMDATEENGDAMGDPINVDAMVSDTLISPTDPIVGQEMGEA